MFEGFRLDPARRRLTAPDGSTVSIQPRVFDLLCLFLAHPGELLDKRAIMDAVWPDTVVDENNLNQAISALRRALGESHDEPRLIATLPRRGYQLIVPVESMAASAMGEAAPIAEPVRDLDPRRLDERRASAAWLGGLLGRRQVLAAVAATLVLAALLGVAALRDRAAAVRGAAPPEASVAVLPFEDLSAERDQAYFADGVAEEIQNELARLDGLLVAGRVSAAAAAQASGDPRMIGRTLGVAHVLAGGVRKDGDRLRISAQLVSTRDGFQLWSQTYDRPVGDVFAIQDEIAESVREALRVTLGVGASGAGAGTRDFDAYDHYLRGRAYAAQSGGLALSAAIGEFRRAVEADPEFGPAWSSMARAADFMVVNEPSRADAHRALHEEATRRAREAGSTSWESIAIEARLLMRTWDWSGAARALRRADETSRATPIEAAEIEGVFLMQVGRVREARGLFEAARVSEPLSFATAASTAWTLELSGDLDAALLEYARAETLPGDDTDWAYQQLLRLLAQGDAAAVDAHLASYPHRSDGVGGLLRRVAEVWRSPQAALTILREAHGDPGIRGPHRLDALAVLAAYYGDAELALALVREEFFGRRGGATVHLWHPLMSEVRRTDGFKSLVRDLGLVDHWRESGEWGDFCRPIGESDFECL